MMTEIQILQKKLDESERDYQRMIGENYDLRQSLDEKIQEVHQLQKKLDELNHLRLLLNAESSIAEFPSLDSADILIVESTYNKIVKLATDCHMAMSRRKIELQVRKRDIEKIKNARNEQLPQPSAIRSTSNTNDTKIRLNENESKILKAVRGILRLGISIDDATQRTPGWQGLDDSSKNRIIHNLKVSSI
jgi:hypothetical protein